MTIKKNIDPVRFGEEVFYNIFQHIFNDEGARKYFEFSQINFFNSTEGLPGWNLWFRENTMAYQLVLIEAHEIFDNEGLSNELSIKGRFAIRYFPDSNAPELDKYSCTETLLRLGPLFDNTGTPTLTGQDCIDDSCFVVGYLDFRTNNDRDFLALECIAPNRWKDVRVDGIYLKTLENGKYEAVKPNGIDRDVPGWDSAFFLFDKLISGCFYTYKTMPCAVILAEKKWIRFDIDKNNSCIETMDPDIDLFHLVTGIEINTDCRRSINPNAYIQGVCTLLSSQGFLFELYKHPENRPNAKINPEWWSAKDMKFSIDADFEMHHCCYHDH